MIVSTMPSAPDQVLKISNVEPGDAPSNIVDASTRVHTKFRRRLESINLDKLTIDSENNGSADNLTKDSETEMATQHAREAYFYTVLTDLVGCGISIPESIWDSSKILRLTSGRYLLRYEKMSRRMNSVLKNIRSSIKDICPLESQPRALGICECKRPSCTSFKCSLSATLQSSDSFIKKMATITWRAAGACRICTARGDMEQFTSIIMIGDQLLQELCEKYDMHSTRDMEEVLPEPTWKLPPVMPLLMAAGCIGVAALAVWRFQSPD